MPTRDPIPAAAEAYRRISSDPDVTIVEPLHGVDDGEAGSAEFRCRLPVLPQPNLQGLPATALLRVHLPGTFPCAPVTLYAEERAFQCFPHQDAETGKLCLQEEHRAPWDVTRLRIYLDWAKGWLSAAATNELLRQGDPYELPDFSRHTLRIPLDRAVFFSETIDTFPQWRGRIGHTGRVELVIGSGLRGVLAKAFSDENGVIVEQPFALGVLGNKKIAARWVLLNDLRVQRQRPAQTFGELGGLFQSSNLDLMQVVRKAWGEENRDPALAVVLVGFPIPQRVGENPCEVHWQPLVFDGYRKMYDELKAKNKNTNRDPMWKRLLNAGTFGENAQLPWGKSMNVSRRRLYSRGQIASLCNKKVVLGGCGALGSIVAECMARSGVPDLAMFDADDFELGNQTRHTLSGSYVGSNKAIGLAHRLQSTNPLSRIRGFPVSLPLSPDPNCTSEDADAAITDADVIIDCTTDHGAFISLDRVSRSTKARMALMFVNFTADLLTLCVSGKHTPCSKVARRLYEAIASGAGPVTSEDYFRDPEKSALVFPGAGCWHPTFPAANLHIWTLALAALDALAGILARPLGTDGTAVLIRRNGTGSIALVEKLWEKAFR